MSPTRDSVEDSFIGIRGSGQYSRSASVIEWSALPDKCSGDEQITQAFDVADDIEADAIEDEADGSELNDVSWYETLPTFALFLRQTLK